ncbi:reverse transcriptase family protein [Aquimarina spinulae]|uniref:reverse transcriptase family protein n=1 Tax=Aquimarina spinulae TaxID=1192023 RepID=UPI000D562806|nr:reverse transcriptase family protein [Aquimarina spinulae]
MIYSPETFAISARNQGHSEPFIELCLAYLNKLNNRGYPVLFSIHHLAQEIGIQTSFLNELIGDTYYFYDGEEKIVVRSKVDYFDQGRYRYYKKFKIKKRTGGYREIMAPQGELKYIQKWIYINILLKYQLTDNCTSFRKGRSIYDNAKPHERKKYILKIDLLKFYDTISEERIFGLFKAMGYVENLSFALARICTAKHSRDFWNSISGDSAKILKTLIENKPAILPQGAPTSPTLANIVANRMDKRFVKLGQIRDFEYTRYADDLTFSSNNFNSLPSISFIKEIVKEEGFFVNQKKTKLFKAGGKQYVTGLTVTNGVNVSKKYRKNIFQHLYYAKKFGPRNHLIKWAKDNKKNPDIMAFQDWLYGHICFISSINKIAGKKMLSEFNKIDWTIL